MKLNFEYPEYFLLVAIIIAAGLSFLLYRKDKSFADLEKWKLRLLAVLRFMFIFIILALLLNPILRKVSIVENKPIIAFVQDNSLSVLLNKDSLYYKNQYKNDVENLLNSLSDEYDVKRLRFGENTQVDTTIDFSDELTNISSVFSEILKRYSGMNIGAVILATDGIYNHGINPVYSRNIRYPVYSIALGDTVQQKDVILKDILHNRITFYKNKFPLRIYISAEKCDEEETLLTITKDDIEVYSKTIKLPVSGETKTLDIELLADRMGLQQYEVFIKPVENEISIENNRADFVIDVIDKRQKILILGNAPHPDIGALRFALKENPNFELEIAYINNFTNNPANYDVVILHQLPSKTNNASRVLTEIEKNKVPVIYILGSDSSIPVFNSISTGISILSQTGSMDNSQALLNPDFVLFETGPDIEAMIKQAPPLRTYFGDYTVSDDVRILMYQVINGIKTDKPLAAFVDRFDIKNGFILGEGIWRWRITDFRFFSSHNNFKELVNKMVQYVSVIKPDEKLITDYKRIYNENEAVVINAELYNEVFELVPNQNVQLNLFDENEREYTYYFRNYGNSYRLDLGKLLPGRYSYKASVSFDNNDYFSFGEFIVKRINIEYLNTTANHNVLFRLAQNTGGKVFFPENMHELPSEIKTDDNIQIIAHKEERSLNISDLYYLFFVILAFTGTEWFLRKFWGSY